MPNNSLKNHFTFIPIIFINPKQQPLMSVIAKMNKSFGHNKIKFSTQSLGRQWKMKQEILSPSFTTRINEIINIQL
ncbi:DUF4113 domain-containing protein [Flavobacterium orientale]|uniref:DUF4113 domain-containing protein n=1 Tax=Flavobacterium orientale TaxID=1756020 RepID=UPI00166CDAC3|nr:DUF4113 domain-containing protein [Flavobacterium orientale]